MGTGTVIPIHERLFDRLELLTVSEVCAILRCDEKTLYQWVKKGSLTAIRVGSKLKFDPADVARYRRSSYYLTPKTRIGVAESMPDTI